MAGLLLILGLNFFLRHQIHQLESILARQIAENLVENLIIGAEVDTSEANIIRLINALNLNREVNSIMVVDLSSNIIVASSKNKYIGKDASSAAIISGRFPAEVFKLGAGEGWISSIDDLFLVANAFELFDKYKQSLRSLVVLVELKESELSRASVSLLTTSMWIILFAVFCLVLFFIVIIRRTLLSRLSRLQQLIVEQMEQHRFVSTNREVGDLLDRITVMFVDMTWAKNQAEQETEKALEYAKKSNSAKAMFLANMSHELRTPLNSVIGFSKRLLVGGKGLDQRQKKAIETIHSSGIYLLTLINDILDLSKIDAGRMDINYQIFDLSELTSQVLDEMAPAAHEKGLLLERALEKELRAELDKQRFQQVLMNLLSNAIKYTNEGGVKVELRTERANWLSIAVSDSGIGINKGDVSRLFKRFEQFDEDSKHKIGLGSGLGLAITKEFVDLLGGRIEVDSAVGEGSAFVVYLPKTPEFKQQESYMP